MRLGGINELCQLLATSCPERAAPTARLKPILKSWKSLLGKSSCLIRDAKNTQGDAMNAAGLIAVVGNGALIADGIVAMGSLTTFEPVPDPSGSAGGR